MTELSKRTLHISLGLLVVIIIFLVTNSFIAGQRWNNIQQSVASIDEQADNNKLHIQSLEQQNTQLQVKLASIETQLRSIDSTLVEIKQELKANR